MCILLTLIFVNCASAAPIQYSGNGHYYDTATSYGISWEAAKSTAEALSFNGMQGHLATITSQDENNFIVTTFNNPAYCWLGGFQPTNIQNGNLEPAGGWQWVTGEKWSYTNWGGGQPDNSGGQEHYLHMCWWDQGKWNDLSNSYTMHGFIVEYEPTTSVPEFPSIVLPVAAVLGLVVIFGRRKNIV